ncbi:MAG: bifunctional 2-keto-4-hydroxyglutarate aldolase/2-keto-3-deoxy-6-phosphogluconate aldolase [Psychrilyobacter sp.]|uniref:bifunctional 2-keto-4-hydroxyglutarate aldolase/2-keto-3-deoxy-6-phosphogluconate aldolase n=1 Tax=Psychrilyobacter sp. TaxID=2586924 RepID=UPI003C74F6E1
MKKFEVLKKISDVGVVAVIRGDSIGDAVNISKACIAGGITAIEVTYTNPMATEIIKKLSKENNIVLGAGTVLDSETARIAIMAGARYIVSPGFDIETAKLCNRYQVAYMPGCMTITEMIKAMESGCDIIKLFPGSAFGPSFIKSIKAPLPQINIMPTGGVNLENVDEWIKNGVIAVGVGGQLTNGTMEQIKETAKKFVEKVRLARG